MSDASLKPPPSRGVSLTTLILTAALTATTTAAAVLAVLYFTGSRPTAAGALGQPSIFTDLTGSAPTPNVQKDTVKPLGHPTGEVFYEVPYASPPHLTLSAPHRVYQIVKQDEFGFSWAADSLLDDFVGDVKDRATAIQVGTAVKKPKVEYEDFTFEAKGIPAGPGVDFQRPFEQTGTFPTGVGRNGQENFVFPYASPPHVTLARQTSTNVVIVEVTNTGFKWKEDGGSGSDGEVTWTATGLRATKLPK